MKQQIVSLLATSLVSIILLIFRLLYSRDSSQNYLFLNLFLAWVPYILSLFLLRYVNMSRRNTMFTVGGSIVWLLFFPNAPYIITDFIHLSSSTSIPFWYEAMLLCAFAFHGIVLGVASLQIMTRIVDKLFGRIVRHIFLYLVIFLSSIGIYAGRILRWNSWDVFFNPYGIISSLTLHDIQLFHTANAVVFILSFSLFFLICYLFFSPIVSIRQRNK